MLTLDVLTVIGFLAAFIAVSAATADVTGIEKRLRRLDRGDPATAEAVRRAQAVTDLARGGYFGLESIAIICTPSRRSLYLSGDDDLEFLPAARGPARTAASVVAEQAPPRTDPPAPPLMLDAATGPDGRHVVARRVRPRRRLARGIRRLLITRAVRRARATSRPPAGSR